MHTAQAASGHTQGEAGSCPEPTPGVTPAPDSGPICIGPSDSLIIQTDARLSHEQILAIHQMVRAWRTQAKQGAGNPLVIHGGLKLVAVMQMPQDSDLACVVQTSPVA